MTIGFLAVSTLATGLTGIAWVNKPYGNPCPRRFVGDKTPQLVERPTMPFVTVLPTNCDPVLNTSQVFKSKCLAGTNGFVDEHSGNLVVHIPLKAGFLAREFLEAVFSRASSNPLQLLTTAVIAHAYFMNMSATEGLSIAISSQIDKTEVYPDGIRSLKNLWVPLPGHSRGFSKAEAL